MDDIPDHLKPIGAHLRLLVGSSKKSDLSTHLSAKTDVETAVQRAQILLGCYRKDDAADPETYAGAVAAVLAEYSPDIVQRVTDPRSGLPSRLQWLPSVKEVRDACEELDARHRSAIERQKRESEQLAARKAEAEHRERRPTLDELKAKHGPNWGLQSDTKAEDIARAERRRDLQIEANRTVFKRECEAAGMSENSPVSPSLVALIKAGMA
jgi:hypothetical protein